MINLSSKLRSYRRIAGCAAILAGCTLAATAGASSSVVVRYTALDLSSAQGTNVLYRHIADAARQVCLVGNLGDLGALVRSRACQTEAIARAVRSVDNPRLAALLAAHSNHG
jgi:UrcA family protein